MKTVFCKVSIHFCFLFFLGFFMGCESSIVNYRTKTTELTSPKGQNWEMKKKGEISVPLSKVSTSSFAGTDWQPAIVPGTVLNSLVKNGVYPEPYYGLNNKITKNIIPDIHEKGRDFYNYVFRTTFKIPPEFEGKEIWLSFKGINYIADIWLNGQNLGMMKGMFKSGNFKINKFATIGGENVLAVNVEPVENPGKPEAIVGKDNVVYKENRNGGNGEIGKDVTMLMSIGWDFTFSDGIRDRNTGIWLPVELYATGPVQILHPFVKTDLPLPDTTTSYQDISMELKNSTEIDQSGIIRMQIPDNSIELQKNVVVPAGETITERFNHSDYSDLVFSNPELWWPFNKGGQKLYTLNLFFEDKNGNILDSTQTSFGIREITSDRNTPDSSRVFYVNGSRFFVHGSNWIPEAMLRKSKERTKTELLYTKQSGINFLRFWGGGISETDYFFSLCDSLGIMLWHEFWMTGDTKPPKDLTLYLNNVKSTIKRIRNHPSLAYYVSSNEQDDILTIKPILDELDGTRGYQFQSECCGVHDGSPYKYENPMQYYDNTASNRGSRIDGFCPEYGTTCLPPIECLREMMPEKEIFPPNPNVWKYLDGNGFHNMATKYLDAIHQYGEPKNAEDLAMKGQLVGYMAYRGIWENWNYNKLDAGDRFASGVLYWYHNSPARQVCGRMWDWSLEPTAALFATQKSLKPLHIQFDYLKNTVSVVNDYRNEMKNLKAFYKVIDFESNVLLSDEMSLNLNAEEVKNDIFTIDFPSDISEVHFVILSLEKNGQIIDDAIYWRSTNKYEGPWTQTGPAYAGFQSLFNLKKVKLEQSNEIISDKVIHCTLSNNSDHLSFFNRLKVVNKKSQLVKSVIYSDNYVSLLPKTKKTITIDLELTSEESGEIKILTEGVNSL